MPRHNYMVFKQRYPKTNDYFETVVKFDEIVNRPKIK